MKRIIVAVVGIVSAIAGAWLHLNAPAMAWPASFSYSGPRSDTLWAIRERAIQDLGLMLVAFGLLVLLIVIVNWLWQPRLEVE
jgi:hypothetical protein